MSFYSTQTATLDQCMTLSFSKVVTILCKKFDKSLTQVWALIDWIIGLHITNFCSEITSHIIGNFKF